MNDILHVIVAHQNASYIAMLLSWWSAFVPAKNILFAYGGEQRNFDLIQHPQKVFIADPRLRTRNHPREKQSYTSVFREASRWMKDQHFNHVYFAEYDHLPLVADLGARLISRLEQERADVLAHHLQRVDGTNFPHYLYELANPNFSIFWETISRRQDRTVILNMVATGSFWRRAVFDAVAKQEETTPIYLELYLPSLAHHLGFRLRDYKEQNQFILVHDDLTSKLLTARAAKVWAIHPIKALGLAQIRAVLGEGF